MTTGAPPPTVTRPTFTACVWLLCVTRSLSCSALPLLMKCKGSDVDKLYPESQHARAAAQARGIQANSSGSRLCFWLKSQYESDLAHSGDAVTDVVVQGNTEFRSAAGEIVAADTAGKCFILHFALHGIGFDFEDRFARLDQGTGRQKAGHFVTGEKGAIKRSFTGDAGVVSMGENG